MNDANARALFTAIEAGDLDKVRSLVSADASLIGAIVDNADPVGWAAFYAQPHVLKYLIESGAELNWRTSRGTSPMGFAVKGAEGVFKSHGVNRPEDMYQQCVALLRAAGAVE